MISNTFKLISLFILDVVTIKMVFSVWAIINIAVFPLAICFVFFSLIMLNMVVILSRKIIKDFGTSLFISAVSSSVFYYLFALIFTGITYMTITPKWYFIFMMLASLLFILVNSGFMIKRNKRAEEKEYMTDVKILMMNTKDILRVNKDNIEAKVFTDLNSSIDRAYDRLNSSTPFGRTSCLKVNENEHEIIRKIENANKMLTEISEEIDIRTAIKMFDDIYYMVCNREKLIVK